MAPDRLTALLAQLPGPLPEGLAERLWAYLHLLEKWNRAYNLTAIREIDEMIPRHVLDSLSVLPFITGPRTLDLGTGAGLPGLVLAMALPDRHFVLLDSNRKKTQFVTQAVVELSLPNVAVVHARCEEFSPDHTFDHVISRAFTSLADFHHVAAPLCHGSVLAMKGRLEDAEWRAVEALHPRRERLTVPGLDAARHLVIFPAAGGARHDAA